MKSQFRQFRVRPHRPLRSGVFYACGLLMLALTFWGAFEYGRYRAGYDGASARVVEFGLKAKITELEQQYADMLQRNASLERSSQIETKARQDVVQKLEAVNEEMLELKEELVFYRSLLSPSDQAPGLHIQSFQLALDDKNKMYSYKLVLTQLRKNDTFASGTVNFYVDGQDQSQGEQTLELKDIDIEQKPTLSFKFKYFQSLEGNLKLPESFAPGDLKIRVVPYGSRLETVEQTYSWDDIITGG